MSPRGGVYYPVLAPFDDSCRVDYDALAELLAFGIRRGVHGVFALGSSGQGPVMEVDQRKAFLEALMETVDGRVPVIAHVGTADTTTTVELAEHADSLDPEMLAALPPYYYDHSSFEITAHFEQVAESVDADLLVYNNPPLAGVDLTPEDVAELCRSVPQVRGIKASFTDVGTLVDYVDRTPDDFAVFSGNVVHLLPGVYHGVAGSIHPPTSLFPGATTDFWDAVQAKDVDRAVEGQRTLRTLSTLVGRFAGRYGRGAYVPLFAMRGVEIARYPRWETVPVPEDATDEIADAFEEAGLGRFARP